MDLVSLGLGFGIGLVAALILVARSRSHSRRDSLMGLPRSDDAPRRSPRHPGGGLTPEVSDEVRKLAASGKKIAAIKRLRNESGLGLKAAKQVVERLD